MVTEDKLGNSLASANHASRIGVNHHIGHTCSCASRSQVATSFHLYHTKAARSGLVLHTGTFEINVAQCGDIDADELAGFQKSSTLGYFNFVIIYCKFYQFFFHDELSVSFRKHE